MLEGTTRDTGISPINATILLEEFKEIKNIERRKEIIGELLGLLEGVVASEKLEMEDTPDDVYRDLASHPKLLIRQERFDQVLELLHGNSVNLSFSGKAVYANAAVFGRNGEGIETAFNEGRASGYGITAAVIIDPDARGAKISVAEVAPAACELRDRSACRSIDGKITKNDIRHFIVRIPARLAPNDYLESGDDSPYIFRTISLSGPDSR